MTEDEYFRQQMESARVAPLDPADGPAGAAPEPSADERVDDRSQTLEPADGEADRRLFEAAMRELDAMPLDAALVGEDEAQPPEAAPPAPRRIRRRKKESRVDERLDLHRCTAEQAAKRLDLALARAARSRSRTVLVITGKGYHSPGGVPVLRREVEEWIRRHGRGHGVDAYAEAPLALGGRGAFVLYLESHAPRRALSSTPGADRKSF